MPISKEEQEVLDRFGEVCDEIHAILDFIEHYGRTIMDGTYREKVYEVYGVDPRELESARRSLLENLWSTPEP